MQDFSEQFEQVDAVDVRQGDVLRMIEGPKQVTKVPQYRKNNVDIKFTFADGSTYTTNQFTKVWREKK